MNAVSAAKGSLSQTTDTNPTAEEDAGFWSLEGLRTAQKDDPDISYIMNLMESSTEKTKLESVSSQSEDVRVLWGFWPRLRIWNGILQRRFESLDGTSVVWQVILPKNMRKEFLTVIHSGMTGGHLARKRTAASIQARAYWPNLVDRLGRLPKRVPSLCAVLQGFSTQESTLADTDSRRTLVQS